MAELPSESHQPALEQNASADGWRAIQDGVVTDKSGVATQMI